MSIFGYFEKDADKSPAFDPGLNVLCPFCLQKLAAPLKTISVMGMDRFRSYFYRAHKVCYEDASAADVTNIESSVIDGRAVSERGES